MVIQNHYSAACDKVFPKCDDSYRSTDAYKCTSTQSIIQSLVISALSFKNMKSFALNISIVDTSIIFYIRNKKKLTLVLVKKNQTKRT